MKKIKIIGIFCLAHFLSACTRGHLVYINAEGEKKTACETEYTWEPSVDQYAVEYVISYCAMRAAAKGYTVLDKGLLKIDRSLAAPPPGQHWSHALAEQWHDEGRLTDKEYGYLIAALDLGHLSNE